MPQQASSASTYTSFSSIRHSTQDIPVQTRCVGGVSTPRDEGAGVCHIFLPRRCDREKDSYGLRADDARADVRLHVARAGRERHGAYVEHGGDPAGDCLRRY